MTPPPTTLRTPLLLGDCPAMAALRSVIADAARSDAKVMILGETGVGKEVVARLVHLQGRRASRPFVAVNCSGIPETLLASELFGHVRGSFTGAYRDKIGLIRQAEGGTLFLDELGEMSLGMQAMLLRFAETGEVQAVGHDGTTARANVRLIAATNRPLRQMVAAGQFREDLYYRLNVVRIHIPPLRARGTDILLLFRHYLQLADPGRGSSGPELTPDAEEALLAHRWPGNVRELRNLTERLVLAGTTDRITAADLSFEAGFDERPAGPPAPAAPPAPAPPQAAVRKVEPFSPSPRVRQLWSEMLNGRDFWEVVQRRFKAHDVTKADLRELIDLGLRRTQGSYRSLVRLFNMPPEDYKRFHSFLYQQKCNLPVTPYRSGEAPWPEGVASEVVHTRAS